VLGWRIAARTPDALVLESEAPGLHVQLVAQADDSAVMWTTFIHYKTRVGRMTFKALTFTHRTLASYLLARAAI
jgi:hypothetical protein